MAIDKNSQVLKQKYEYHEQLSDLKIKSDACKKLVSPDIYEYSGGRLVYVVNYPDGKKILGKELLNARYYKSVMYFSGYPYLQRILMVSWDYDSHIVGGEGIKTSTFIRKLNSHGLCLLVSGRAQKEAASVLLAYSVENAEPYELPFASGWWVDVKADWHFAKKGSLTMREVQKRIGW